MLSEAGRGYFVQSYAAIMISLSLALGGMIIGWSSKNVKRANELRILAARGRKQAKKPTARRGKKSLIR